MTDQSETPSPTRRLQLLEARLSRNNPLQPPPEDDVRSFSSDAPPHSPKPANPRRKYAPPPAPRSQSRDATVTTTPTATRPRTPSAPAKKRRRGASPANTSRNRRVDSYFKPVDSPKAPKSLTKRALHFVSPTAVDDRERERDRHTSSPDPDAYAGFRGMVDHLRVENQRLKDVCKLSDDIKAENEDLRAQVEIEMPELQEKLDEREAVVAKMSGRNSALVKALKVNVVQLATMEREEGRRRTMMESERLGKLVVERSGTSLQETWEEGLQWKKLHIQLRDVQEERELVEKKRKDVSKKKTLHQKNENGALKDLSEDAARTDMPPPPSPLPRVHGVPFEDTAAYAHEQEEVYRVRLQLLKREESALHEQRQKLTRERDILVRELRRQNDERNSAFSDFPILNDRYVVLNLLGRGGFSEVFKAFDLQDACYVACKIHQLASNWSEEKKRNFIRHAMREYEIHKSLKHPRVVQLVDIFEIDENTFCTVLEYCDGSDLDSYLRTHKTLSEKEAKSIISQVFSGLLYLAEQKRRIIHYDLKPGNILLHKGEVQITDFGLSKIMSESESTVDGMELTSQGAGTMWYLPPECFETSTQARISMKVDVWSAGVILFQILYGRKPFGHGLSQEKMFREKTVNHQELEFPSKPSVSEGAKAFMAKCLTRRVASRPDVREILLHPFLRKR